MTSARRQLVPLPSNLNTGKRSTPQGHPCFSFRPLEQLKGKTALKGKWAEMKGNDRQNQNFPAIAFCVAVVPPTHPFPHAIGPLFQLRFSYDSRTNRTNISCKKIFYSYDGGPIPSYDFTHDGWTKAPPWRRRASQPDTNRWLLPPPSSIPIGTRPQAGSKLQSDQTQPRKSAIAAKASQPDTKSPALPPASPPLFRPQSEHNPKLAQSYGRNNRNTMRAET